MADVFLSYSREDAARAEQVARGLQASGLEVFWDTEIPPGTTWADYIEQKLAQCKALIVLWSEHSTKSQWVREEARMGRDKGVLIPVMIDGSQPPFGFGEVQAANLADWNGSADHAGWRRFIAAVSEATQRAPRPAAAPPLRPATPQHIASAPAQKKGMPVWVWVTAAVVGTIVVLGIIGSTMETPNQNFAQTPATTQQPVMTPPQTGQQPVGDQNPQQTNMNQLQQISTAFGQQGFQMVGQPFNSSLAGGASQNVPVEMQVGYQYQIVGVCDNDCSNMDIVVYDGYGNAIGHDTLADSAPVVGIVPTGSGQFTAQVNMVSCSVNPCYFSAALYARPAQ